MKKLCILMLALAIMLSSVAALAEYGAVLRRNTRIYRDSSMTGSTLTLPKYTAVIVKSVDHGKAEIVLGDRTVWIKSRNLGYPWKSLLAQRRKQGIEHTEDLIRYAKEACWVYDHPSTTANRIKRVKKGTVMNGGLEYNGWTVVLDKEQVFYGYIKTSSLEGLSGADGSHYALK